MVPTMITPKSIVTWMGCKHILCGGGNFWFCCKRVTCLVWEV